MSTFTLAISCLTWTQHSGFLCNTVFHSIGLYCYHQSHPQLSVVFALAPSLHSFRTYFSTDLSSILGTYWPRKVIFQCPFCLFMLFLGFSRQEYWSGFPFPSPMDHIFSVLSTMILPSWVALHGMAHSFIELDKAVAHVIRLVSFLGLWFSFCLPSDGEG